MCALRKWVARRTVCGIAVDVTATFAISHREVPREVVLVPSLAQLFPLKARSPAREQRTSLAVVCVASGCEKIGKHDVFRVQSGRELLTCSSCVSRAGLAATAPSNVRVSMVNCNETPPSHSLCFVTRIYDLSRVAFAACVVSSIDQLRSHCDRGGSPRDERVQGGRCLSRRGWYHRGI